jgi:hypothetical protein
VSEGVHDETRDTVIGGLSLMPDQISLGASSVAACFAGAFFRESAVAAKRTRMRVELQAHIVGELLVHDVDPSKALPRHGGPSPHKR